MNETLPPPNWSPTGNSGCWVWDEQYTEKFGKTPQTRGAWRWYDDVHGYDYQDALRARRAFGSPPPPKDSWFTRIKKFFKIGS
tara:strand:- start:13912 stop:14160 length:249 start_codon:yes stop_codon:yes gene_type:complete